MFIKVLKLHISLCRPPIKGTYFVFALVLKGINTATFSSSKGEGCQKNGKQSEFRAGWNHTCEDR